MLTFSSLQANTQHAGRVSRPKRETKRRRERRRKGRRATIEVFRSVFLPLVDMPAAKGNAPTEIVFRNNMRQGPNLKMEEGRMRGEEEEEEEAAMGDKGRRQTGGDTASQPPEPD